MMTTRLGLLTLCIILPLGVGCSGNEQTVGAEQSAGQQIKAEADLQPASGSQVKGTITFEKKSNNVVQVMAHVTGLTPGKHGIHIHQSGDCSAPDASSAGPHYNPTGRTHGDPSPEHHMGDLGNIEAGANGEGHLDLSTDFIAMDGPNSVIGKAVVVHAQPDDLASQPAGNSGVRVACGVIRKQ